MQSELCMTLVPPSIKTILSLAMGYVAMFYCNGFLFDSLQFSHGVNWVFLPSGLRLLLVLIFGFDGALGISLGSLIINYALGDTGVFAVGKAVISGFSPLLARYMVVHHFSLGRQLEGIQYRMLFKISVTFALVSAVAHQLWFFWHEKTENFVSSTLVMALGDLLGTALVLTLFSWLIRTFKLSADRTD